MWLLNAAIFSEIVNRTFIESILFKLQAFI